MDYNSTILSIGKNRCRTEIVATIISLSRDREFTAEIMEKANLNMKQLSRYLDELTRLGLIEVKKVDEETACSATREGKQFLEQYNRLKKFLE